MKKPQVIIIGGGAAGLYAASELSPTCAVTLLESRQQLGGRIRSFALDSNDGVIEAGAEFVHGHLPITGRLAQEAGAHVVPLEGKMFRREGKEWKEQDEMIEGWEGLLKKMKQETADMTMQEFMRKHYNGDQHDNLRRHIKLFVQGFDLADPEKVSMQSLYEEWSHDTVQQRIADGYGALIDYLERKAQTNGCNILKGDAVRQVDWQPGDVTVYTAAGNKYSAEQLLITVPIGVLRDVGGPSAMNVTPPIDEYIEAARNIGYGTVVKAVFSFSERFWQEDLGFVFSDEMIPTWWTQYPTRNNILTGWAGGPVAERISAHSEQEINEIALHAVARTFGITVEEIRSKVKQSWVFNWTREPDANGAYSYSTLQSREARKVLQTPLGNTVFFAGEALYEGVHPGTVEAAFESAQKALFQMTAKG